MREEKHNEGGKMKNGKRPTRQQKKLLGKLGLNPMDWLVSKNMPGEMVIIHRHTNKERRIPLGEGNKKSWRQTQLNT